MGRPKESDREDIRALVLEKAKRLFLDIGYKKLTIRRLAQEIGYTVGTIYLYYRNKDEILYELHNEGFRLLYEYKQRVVVDEAVDAIERLHNGGRVYIDFALENPDYYELMFNMPEPKHFMDLQAVRSGVVDDYAMRSFNFLRESIRLCMEEGYLKGYDADTAAFMFWSFVHGLVSLIIRKRIPYSQAPTRQFAYQAVGMMMNLVRSGKLG
jgi:AcrR family transcriptional regulator